MSRIRQPIDSRQCCSFCGKSVDHVGVLIISAPASICDCCVAEFQKFIDGWRGERRAGKRIVKEASQ